MPGCFNVPTRRYSNGRVFVYCSGAVSPFVKQADAQRTSVAPMVKATPSAAVRGRPSSREAMLDAAETVVVKRSEEHTSELQSLMRNSYAVLCLKKKK